MTNISINRMTCFSLALALLSSDFAYSTAYAWPLNLKCEHQTYVDPILARIGNRNWEPPVGSTCNSELCITPKSIDFWTLLKDKMLRADGSIFSSDIRYKLDEERVYARSDKYEKSENRDGWIGSYTVQIEFATGRYYSLARFPTTSTWWTKEGYCEVAVPAITVPK